jgi:PIN domain nuclease of toxin-antitoxin system
VALESRRVGVAHGDPADRFIAATANVYELVLVTSDANLLAGKGYRTLANT